MRVDISSLSALRSAIGQAASAGWDSAFAGDLTVAVHGELSFGRLGRRFNYRLPSCDVTEHTVADVWDVLSCHTEAVLDAANPLGYIAHAVYTRGTQYFMADEGVSPSVQAVWFSRQQQDVSRFQVEGYSLDSLIATYGQSHILARACDGVSYPVDRARVGLSVDDFMTVDGDCPDAPVLSRFVAVLEDAGLDNAADVVAALTQLAAKRRAVQRREIRAWAREYGLADQLGVDSETIDTVANLMFPRSSKEDQCLLRLVAQSIRTGERLRVPDHIGKNLTSLRSSKLDATSIAMPAPVREFSQPELPFDLGMAG